MTASKPRMHRHDLDLIAALADGSLENQNRALSLVESCEVCRNEFESQKAILQNLSAIEPATLSELERSSLHRDVLTSITEGPREASTSTPSRSMWARWGYAAAGVFVVIGFVGVLTQMGGVPGNDGVASLNGEGSQAPQSPRGLAGADDEEEPGTPTTPTTPTTAFVGEDSGSTVPGEVSPAALETVIDEAREIAGPAAIAEFADSATAETALDCLDASGLGREQYRLIGEIDETSEYLTAIPQDGDYDASTPITVLDFDTCQIVTVSD